MNRKLLPLVAALSLLGAASLATAQSLVRPDPARGLQPIGGAPGAGLGSIELPPPVEPGSAAVTVDLRGTVTGRIEQTVQDSQSSKVQRAVVGGARNLQGAAGAVATDGVLAGTIRQSTSPVGSSGSAVQEIGIAEVAGGSLRDTRARGLVDTTITQNNLGAGDGGTQSVDVGSVRNSGGGSLTTDGIVTQAGVTQLQVRAAQQRVQVASVEDATIGSARTRGLVGGAVLQDAAVGPSAFAAAARQTVAVGAIEGSVASTVDTDGQLLGDVDQRGPGGASQRVGVASILQVQGAQSLDARGVVTGALSQDASNALGSQTIEVGSVDAVQGAGVVATDGTVAAPISQASNGRVRQEALVAVVRGGGPSSASARGVLTGALNQSSFGIDGVAGQQLQRVSVGSIVDSRGQVVTDAVLAAQVQQTMRDSRAVQTQALEVGQVTGGAGAITARASVQGTVSQSLGRNESVPQHQAIRIGSVASGNAQTVRTEATVSGELRQSGTGRGRLEQTISVGALE